MNAVARVFRRCLSPAVRLTAFTVCLMFLLWFYGPAVTIGTTRPLETARVRIVVIGLVLLVWLCRVGRQGRFAGAVLTIPAFVRRLWSRPSVAPDDIRIEELRRRFHEALRRSALAPSGIPWLKRCIDSLTGRRIYALPWYVVLGTPGSGKTSFMRGMEAGGSTITDPLHATDERVAQAQSEWWFCEHGVFVDTPGRYLSADSPQHDDEWRELLELLGRNRRMQPVNGVILTVSVPELLERDESQGARYASGLRLELLKMQDRLGMRVPVYLFFTKIDLLAGFGEYFAGLNRDARRQAWGMAFSQPDRGDASGPVSWFALQFGFLSERLYEGLVDVLGIERDRAGRALAYLFPQEFEAIGEPLRAFFMTFSRSTSIEPQVAIRGAYFISSVCTGEPVERVLAPVMREVGACARPVGGDRANGSLPFFISQVMDCAVVPHTRLATGGIDGHRRNDILRTGAAVLVLTALLAVAGALALSYGNNSAYVGETEANASRFAKTVASRDGPATIDLLSLSKLLDGMRTLAVSHEFDVSEPPLLSYRMGLYQGDRMMQAADSVYQRALEQRLLPQLAARIETQLADVSPDDLVGSYDALKAYLMLYDTKHYDGEFLADRAIADLDHSMPASVTREERFRLGSHVIRLFGRKPVVSPFLMNGQLVDAVRLRLERYPFAQRAYGRLRQDLLDSTQRDAVTVAGAGGPRAALVLSRRSGLPLTRGIAWLYTYHGFRDGFEKIVGKETARMAEDDRWVLGRHQTSDGAGKDNGAADVRREYFSDYIEVWDSYLSDLTIVSAGSLAQSAEIARTLSGSGSPLRRLLQVASEETTLWRDPDSSRDDLAGRMREHLEEKGRSFARMLSEEHGSVRPEAVVDTHFEAVHSLMAGSGREGNGAAPIDDTLRLLDELYSYLTSASAALADSNTPPPTDIFDRMQAQAGRLPVPLRETLEAFSRTSLANVASAARQGLSTRAVGTIGTICRQTIAGRYPFARSEGRDVAMDDFTRMFAPEGLMDSFFQRNLSAQVDMSGRQWKYKDDILLTRKGDSTLLESFRNAGVIRDAFFAGSSAKPSIHVVITPLEVDPDITQYTLTLDGQTLHYAHGPQTPVSMKWPASEASGSIILQINTVDGTGTTLQARGPWALQRFFEYAGIVPGSGPENFTANFTVGGRHLSLGVATDSVYSPFNLPELRAFRCPS